MTQTQHHLSDQQFTDFDLPPEILAGIEQAGFSHLTPIQASVLPRLLAGGDVAGCFATLSGRPRTAAPPPPPPPVVRRAELMTPG